MQKLNNSKNGHLVALVADSIIENKQFLSEIDGKIGDGDHGVNMSKGFNTYLQKSNDNISLSQGFKLLSDILMNEIGGSMGPLYGVMFMSMSESIEDKQDISAEDFLNMLKSALSSVTEIGSAEVGDKTLVDCLDPSIHAFEDKLNNKGSFEEALDMMSKAAEAGRDSTIDMVAKIGRSSRLGERSRGVLDAGATSCCLILTTLAGNIPSRLN